MKYCNLCNSVYEDDYVACPTCGTQLVTASANMYRRTEPNSNPQRQQRNIYERTPQHQFMDGQGNRAVFNGIVVESNTQQFFQSKLTKIIRAVFSSEPYQLSHTSYVTTFRIEEHSLQGYPEQAQDIVLYGGIRNIFAQGDDVTVTTKRRGRQYVATRVYNNSINSNIRIEANIPAAVVRVFAVLLIAALVAIICTICSIDYAAAGQAIGVFFKSLIPTIVTIGLIWYFVKSFFKKR